MNQERSPSRLISVSLRNESIPVGSGYSTSNIIISGIIIKIS